MANFANALGKVITPNGVEPVNTKTVIYVHFIFPRTTLTPKSVPNWQLPNGTNNRCCPLVLCLSISGAVQLSKSIIQSTSQFRLHLPRTRMHFQTTNHFIHRIEPLWTKHERFNNTRRLLASSLGFSTCCKEKCLHRLVVNSNNEKFKCLSIPIIL